jgi:hypothetical protein
VQHRAAVPVFEHSILDIPPVTLGGIIQLPDADDDILAEMIEERA